MDRVVAETGGLDATPPSKTMRLYSYMYNIHTHTYLLRAIGQVVDNALPRWEQLLQNCKKLSIVQLICHALAIYVYTPTICLTTGNEDIPARFNGRKQFSQNTSYTSLSLSYGNHNEHTHTHTHAHAHTHTHTCTCIRPYTMYCTCTYMHIHVHACP